MISPTVSPAEWPCKVEIDFSELMNHLGPPATIVTTTGATTGYQLFERFEELTPLAEWLDDNETWFQENYVEAKLEREFIVMTSTTERWVDHTGKSIPAPIPQAAPRTREMPKAYVYHFKSQEAATLFKLFRGQ